GEVDLTVADRAEAPCPVYPGLEAAIDALTTGWIELGILHVEGLDAILVDVDVVEIVELLQHEVARIVEQVGARVVVHALKEHLVGDAVVQVLAGMDFVADVDARFIKGVEDRRPAAGQFVEGFLDKTSGTLWPGIE